MALRVNKKLFKILYSFGFAVLVSGFLLAMLLVDNWSKVPLIRDQYVWVKPKAVREPPEISILPKRPVSWVSYADISRAAIGAVIVSEDWSFFEHDGIDWAMMKEAIETDVKKGKLARGGSTITQQLVKNIFLTRQKSFLRKFEEMILATRVDAILTKKRILELYFNVVEWGPGVYGIKHASRFYFAKSPAQLTAKEAAFLAMLLPSPIRYGQSFRNQELTRYAEKTIESVLQKMVTAKFLTEDERVVEVNRKLSFEKRALDNDLMIDQEGVSRSEL